MGSSTISLAFWNRRTKSSPWRCFPGYRSSSILGAAILVMHLLVCNPSQRSSEPSFEASKIAVPTSEDTEKQIRYLNPAFHTRATELSIYHPDFYPLRVYLYQLSSASHPRPSRRGSYDVEHPQHTGLLDIYMFLCCHILIPLFLIFATTMTGWRTHLPILISDPCAVAYTAGLVALLLTWIWIGAG